MLTITGGQNNVGLTLSLRHSTMDSFCEQKIDIITDEGKELLATECVEIIKKLRPECLYDKQSKTIQDLQNQICDLKKTISAQSDVSQEYLVTSIKQQKVIDGLKDKINALENTIATQDDVNLGLEKCRKEYFAKLVDKQKVSDGLQDRIKALENTIEAQDNDNLSTRNDRNYYIATTIKQQKQIEELEKQLTRLH